MKTDLGTAHLPSALSTFKASSILCVTIFFNMSILYLVFEALCRSTWGFKALRLYLNYFKSALITLDPISELFKVIELVSELIIEILQYLDNCHNFIYFLIKTKIYIYIFSVVLFLFISGKKWFIYILIFSKLI